MEKLYWLNRHYIKEAPLERLEKLALPYYTHAIAEDLAKDPAGICPSGNNITDPINPASRAHSTGSQAVIT